MKTFAALTLPMAFIRASLVLVLVGADAADTLNAVGAGTPSAQRQLPLAMHGAMADRPVITVGRADADLVGADQRVLQAAVDYIAGLGGGTVEIGPGEFLMRDSLHLRSGVAVRGRGSSTLLRKAPASVSALALDGDFGEEQVTLAKPDGFGVGQGVAVWDRNAGGFHITVARITGRNGNTFSISRPLMADCMVENGAQAATVFPVISGYDAEGVRVEDLTIEGNREQNVPLDGCRGGGIYFYRCHGAVIRNCTVRHYNGDGFSFQQSNDVTVEGCVSEENSSLGFHPGSGSQRPRVRECLARANGADGLFLCWRVKEGVFENNRLENNGRFGISIGHKDTDNLLRNNRVIGNAEDGIFFRNELEGMAGHRNVVVDNLIENNGAKDPAAGIRVRGATHDLVFRNNVIRDTRPAGERRQAVGIRLEEKVGSVTTTQNTIEADTAIEDRRSDRAADRAQPVEQK